MKRIDVDMDDDKPDLNDTNEDGCLDVNIEWKDTEGTLHILNVDHDNITCGHEPDRVSDQNIDSDGDGEADLNIDTDGDQIPDIHIDTKGDFKPHYNIAKLGETKPYLNIGKIHSNWNPDINYTKDDFTYDSIGIHEPILNMDTDGGGQPDVNVDLDDDGESDINMDVNDNGIPDVNLDPDSDGKPITNVMTLTTWQPNKNDCTY